MSLIFLLDCINALFFFFFFSSRRRHTRLTCDWSSDVCSSDLDEHDAQVSYSTVAKYVQWRRAEIAAGAPALAGSADGFVPQAKEPGAEAEVDFGDVTA